MAFTWTNSIVGYVEAQDIQEIRDNCDWLDNNLECITHNSTYLSGHNSTNLDTHNSAQYGTHYSGYYTSKDTGHYSSANNSARNYVNSTINVTFHFGG